MDYIIDEKIVNNATMLTLEEQYYELDKVIRTKLQYEKKPRI